MPRTSDRVSDEGWTTDKFKRDHGVFVTTDTVILSLSSRTGQLSVRLIQRLGRDQTGSTALPGGYMEPDEFLAQAAHREAGQETGIDTSKFWRQLLDIYDHPQRAEGKRVIGSAYVAFGVDVESVTDTELDGDARDLGWFPVSALSLPGQTPRTAGVDLAFTGAQSVAQALEALTQWLEVG